MRSIFLFLLAVVLTAGVKAQSELTLPLMKDVFQSSYVNPAFIPEHTVSVGLPGMSSVYVQVISNGFVPAKVIEFRDDTAHVIPSRLLSQLRKKNLICAGVSTDLLHVLVKIRSGFYWMNVRSNLSITGQLPKELFSLKDGTDYLGKQVDLSNLRLNALAYNEYSIGTSRELKHWIIGGRLSLLQGIASVHFKPSKLDVGIDSSMYAYTFAANAALQTAGIPKDGNGDPDFDHLGDPAAVRNYLKSFHNKGISLSAGATWIINDRIRLSFAFSDLGFIRWRDSVTTYRVKGQSGFKGLDVIRSYLDDTPIKGDSVIHSIWDDFARDTLESPYTTFLNPKFYSSVSYDVFPRSTVTFSISAVYNSHLYPALTLGISQGLGRYVDLVASASYNQRSIHNLGAGLMIKPGPVQIFVVTDNFFPAINPMVTTNAISGSGSIWCLAR